MELKELMGLFEGGVNKEKYCKAEDKKEPAGNRTAKINKWGSRTGCSGQTLYDNMKPSTTRRPGKSYLSAPEPFVAKPTGTNYKWELNNVSPTHFPIQAHHIIPKNHLPEQGICAFLSKGCDEHPKVQLTADTFYDTDHANNGYCMPYATPLAEWKKAGNDDIAKMFIAFEVMHETGRQLHQGSHRAGPYTDPPDGHEDDGEGSDDDPMHEKGVGYLDEVTRLLKIIQDGVDLHVTDPAPCPDCSKNQQGGKIQLPPIDAVVRQVDQVSGIVKLQLDANIIFVSELAHLLWNTNRRTLKRPDWL